MPIDPITGELLPYDDEMSALDLSALISGAPPGAPPDEGPDFDIESLLGPTEQQPLPQDFWSRLAMGGVRMPTPEVTSRTTGGGLAGLAALASGFVNARTSRAAQELARVERQNKQATENARALANLRWEKRKQEMIRQRMLEGIEAQRLARTPPGEVAYQTELGRRRAAAQAGPTTAEKRAQLTTDRALAASARADQRLMQSAISDLVRQYNADPAISAYRFIRGNLETAEANAQLKTGLGDVTLIFAYGRAREPENPNVLREGEYSTASNAAGAFESTKTLLSGKRFFQGDRLTDAGRQKVLASIRAIEKSRRQTFRQAQDQFKLRAKIYEVDPNVFIREPESLAEPTTAPPTPGARRVP